MEAFQRFEAEWSKWAGVENTVGCSSGTAALHLALEALQLPSGSAVILPDYTMVACARAVTLAGLRPVFVDVTDEGLIDPARVEDAAGQCFASAVMAVHVYGRVCDMPTLHDVAGKYDLKVIEDLAEAHLTKPYPNTHASCWSFYKNKVVFGEEGGAVAFRHDLTEECDLATQLRSLGFTADHDYTHIPRGHNYRLSNLHAEVILLNLRQVTIWTEVRRNQESIYNRLRPTMLPVLSSRETPWVYDVLVPGMTVEQQGRIIQKLWDCRIPARYAFKPMTVQPEYRSVYSSVREGWTSDRLSKEVICLPLGQSLGGDVRYAARVAFDTICEVMGQAF